MKERFLFGLCAVLVLGTLAIAINAANPQLFVGGSMYIDNSGHVVFKDTTGGHSDAGAWDGYTGRNRQIPTIEEGLFGGHLAGSIADAGVVTSRVLVGGDLAGTIADAGLVTSRVSVGGDLAGTIANAGVAQINGRRVPWKGSARLACLANVTKSGAQSCDGQTTTDGDVVLLTAQTNAADNVLWTTHVAADGGAVAWVLAPDTAASADIVAGSEVTVTEGPHAGRWRMTTPTPDAGGFVLGSTALRWIKQEKVIDLLDPPFNAACDGTTPDDTAITSWLAACAAAGARAQCTIPAATCAYASTITWPKNVTVTGQGPEVSILKYTGISDASAHSEDASIAVNINLDRFQIQCSAACTSLLKLTSGWRMSLDRMKLDGLTIGGTIAGIDLHTLVGSPGNIYDLTVRHSEITGMAGSGVHTEDNIASLGILFEHNRIWNHAQNCFHVDANTNSGSTSLTLRGNVFANCTLTGLLLENVTQPLLEANEFEANGTHVRLGGDNSVWGDAGGHHYGGVAGAKFINNIFSSYTGDAGNIVIQGVNGAANVKVENNLFAGGPAVNILPGARAVRVSVDRDNTLLAGQVGIAAAAAAEANWPYALLLTELADDRASGVRVIDAGTTITALDNTIVYTGSSPATILLDITRGIIGERLIINPNAVCLTLQPYRELQDPGDWDQIYGAGVDDASAGISLSTSSTEIHLRSDHAGTWYPHPTPTTCP